RLRLLSRRQDRPEILAVRYEGRHLGFAVLGGWQDLRRHRRRRVVRLSTRQAVRESEKDRSQQAHQLHRERGARRALRPNRIAFFRDPGKEIVEVFSMADAPSSAQISAAREKLDAQVREVVQWHFHPDTGTPFWLDRAKTFQFNPLKDVQGFDDLK